MKIICTLLSIILFVGFLVLTFIMQNNTLISIFDNFPAISVVIYSILIFILGFLSGFVFNQGNIEKFKSAATKQTRKAEKISIDTQENLDKIDRLNAKIVTLETALKKALENK